MPGRITLALVSVDAIAAGSWGCRGERLPPNVLLITIDTLRADYLGSYGFPYASSPRIDALAEQGVLFERAIAASSTTSPPTHPSSPPGAPASTASATSPATPCSRTRPR